MWLFTLKPITLPLASWPHRGQAPQPSILDKGLKVHLPMAGQEPLLCVGWLIVRAWGPGVGSSLKAGMFHTHRAADYKQAIKISGCCIWQLVLVAEKCWPSFNTETRKRSAIKHNWKITGAQNYPIAAISFMLGGETWASISPSIFMWRAS